MPQFRKKIAAIPTLVSVAVLLVGLISGLFMQPTTRLEPAAVGVTMVLFLICVWLIPIDRLSEFYSLALWVFIFGTLLNVAYELWHSLYFTHFTTPEMAYPELVQMLFQSSLGDGLLAVINLLSVTMLQRGRWPHGGTEKWSTAALVIVLALAIQIGIELGALATGRWAYNGAMPIIPVLGIGLTPVIQMPLLMLPILSLAYRVSRPMKSASAG